MREPAVAACLVVMMMGFGRPAGAQAPPQAGQVSDASTFIVRPGDMLRIRVWPDAENHLAGEFQVEESGLVYLPLLGEVSVGGKSLAEVRRAVREGYEQAIRAPVVTLMPLFTVSILGGVERPGLYRIDPTQALFDLVSLAGGFTENAKLGELRLIRDGHVYSVDAGRAIETGEPLLAMSLRSKDRIIVPESKEAFLTFTRFATILQMAISVVTIVELTRR